MIEEDKKIEFFKDEYIDAPLSEKIGFRCTKRLSSWLRAQELIEGKDHSAVIRRILTWGKRERGSTRMVNNLKEHIKGLPGYCHLIPVNGKVPIESDWRNNTYL